MLTIKNMVKKAVSVVFTVTILITTGVCIFLWVPRIIPIEEVGIKEVLISTTEDGDFIDIDGWSWSTAKSFTDYIIEYRDGNIYIAARTIIPFGSIFGVNIASIFHKNYSSYISVRIRMANYPEIEAVYWMDNNREEMIYSFKP